MFKLFTKTSTAVSRSIYRSDASLSKSIYSAASARPFHPIFNYYPTYSFSTNIPPSDNNKFKKKNLEQSDQPKSLNQTDSSDPLKDLKEDILKETRTSSTNTLNGLSLDNFVLFIQNKEAHVKTPDVYRSKTIYTLSNEFKIKSKIPKFTSGKLIWPLIYAVESFIWLPLTYLAYIKLHPIAAVLPVIAWGFTLSFTRNLHKFMDSSIIKLDLENNGKIVLYSWGNQGKGVTCQIEGAVLSKIIETDNKDEVAENGGKVGKSVCIEAVFFEDSQKKREVNAIFMVSADGSAIENVNLFKDIVNGRYREISKYQYVPNVEKTEETEETEEKV